MATSVVRGDDIRDSHIGGWYWARWWSPPPRFGRSACASPYVRPWFVTVSRVGSSSDAQMCRRVELWSRHWRKRNGT